MTVLNIPGIQTQIADSKESGIVYELNLPRQFGFKHAYSLEKTRRLTDLLENPTKQLAQLSAFWQSQSLLGWEIQTGGKTSVDQGLVAKYLAHVSAQLGVFVGICPDQHYTLFDNFLRANKQYTASPKLVFQSAQEMTHNAAHPLLGYCVANSRKVVFISSEKEVRDTLAGLSK